MSNIVSLNMPAAYWLDKARHARSAVDPSDAIRFYTAAIRQDSDVARLELAELYIELGCFSAAERCLLHNLQKSAHDVNSFFALGRCHNALGDIEAMAELFDLFLRLFPSGAKSDAARDILWHLPRRAPVARHTHRAAALFNQSTSRSQNAALKLLLKSYKIRPTAPAAGAICEVFLQMRLTSQAIRYGYEAIRLDPSYADHRLHLACCLEAAGLHRSAALTLQEAEKYCDTPYKALRLCSCAIQLNQFDVELTVSEKWRKKYPFSAEFLQMHLASLRADLSLWGQALSLLPLARTIDPEDLALQAYAAMDWDKENFINEDNNKE